MQKTVEQLQADWVSHGNIARLQAKLASEQNEGVRKALEALLAREREAIAQSNIGAL
jgi:DNA-directed RNA polymerase specialized sigma24 family protein